MRRFHLSIAVLSCITTLIVSCDHSCNESEAKFRKKSYRFKIERYVKEQEKINIFEGTGDSGRKEVFRNIGLGNVYDNASIGDSLIKYIGSTGLCCMTPPH